MAGYIGKSQGVVLTDIDDDSVETADIKDGAVTADKLAAGAADLVSDTSPQLGGNLDLNGNDITGTGDISASTITTTGGSGGTALSLRSGGDINIYAANDTDVAELFCDSPNQVKTNGTIYPVSGLTLADGYTATEHSSVKLASVSTTGSFTEIVIPISPSLTGYRSYTLDIHIWKTASNGEIYLNYRYSGSTKKSGWYGGYVRVGEGNSYGNEGYSSQSQCRLIGSNTTEYLSNAYAFSGRVVCHPFGGSSGNGRFIWHGIGRLSSGLSCSINGAALSTNTSVPDAIVVYANVNTTEISYTLYGHPQ